MRVTFPTTAEATPRSGRLSGLDGLRAIAVTAVVLYHFLPDSLTGGFVGVDVFFVISGFLITTLLVRERATTGRISLGGFWRRRARRLLPALALVVVVCSAVALFLGGDVLVGLGTQVLGAATFSSNWLYILLGGSYFDATTPELFRNLWSLAVEEQFYLLWPLLLLLLLLVKSPLLRAAIAGAIAAASATAMFLLATEDGTRVYYGTDTHSFGLALGAALAFVLSRDAPAPARAWRVILPIVGALALAGVILVAVLLPEASALTTHGGLALVAVLTAIAIAGATAAGSWLGRALDVAPMRWVGERSYGLYLWHWPVLVLAVAALPIDSPWWIAPSIALVTTVVVSALSYRFVESPLRRHGLRGLTRLVMSSRRVLQVTAATLAVLVAWSTGLTAAAIVMDPHAGEAEASVSEGMERLALPAFGVAPRRPQPLPTGDQIYAVGDSVMLAATPQLQEAFPGIAIDATVSRSMSVAPDIVAGIINSGALRPILVIGLGTNGWIKEDSLDAIHAMLPPETLMIVVNVQAPREWEPSVNEILADFASHERDVELANWHDAIAPQLDVLARDQIHPGATGGEIYATALAQAVQRLAEIPPLLNNNQYEYILRPV